MCHLSQGLGRNIFGWKGLTGSRKEDSRSVGLVRRKGFRCTLHARNLAFVLNAEDVELCYNLGIKLGAKGRSKEEKEMYARATQVDPKFGGGWLNWGTTLAESGNMDDIS